MAYDFAEIEKKWLEKTNNFDGYKGIDFDSREKKYVLVEFPYPSGEGLHVGHAFSMTGADVYARFLRKQGFNVMFPMGFDAFGLPAENYAIKTGVQPQITTDRVTKLFRKQMDRLGLSFDWDREVNTTHADYYKWTQWIFVKLFEKGLAHKQEMPINWCPSCKIGLANEEVIDGNCERCGTATSKRNISQWVVKITAYADKLIEGLKDTDFIEKVRAAQVNWIGKKDGAKVKFKIKNREQHIEVFTTRPDTIFGSTFLVVAPEHPIVKEITDEKVVAYVSEVKGKTEIERNDKTREKAGVFSGLYAINPANNKEIPVWVADYVLMGFGTGAIMAVPAHSEPDFAFYLRYKEFLEYRAVTDVGGMTKIEGEKLLSMVGDGLDLTCVEGDGKLVNSGSYDGLTSSEARTIIVKDLEKQGVAELYTTYHLRDWIFSRQHYWGEPIPMVDCPKCGWVTVPEAQLPVVLPEVEKYQPTDTGESPLAAITDWVKTTCPKCGGEAKRETDTMPNWAGSDWYFLRYTDNKNEKVLADMKKMKYWLPVDVYVGGDEHNTLHLLYSRFIYQFLYDLGEVPKEHPEPYKKRLSHGVILAPDGKRMSKSKGNVISPDTEVDKYGADVLRTYMMFIGPFDATMAWNERSLIGVKRFIEKFSNFVAEKTQNLKESKTQNEEDYIESKVLVSKLVKVAGDDLSQFKFNTVVARLMETLNNLTKEELAISKEDLEKIIVVLSVFAPFVTEELWSVLGNTGSVHSQLWPKVDEKYLVESEVNISVAINGKMRAVIKVPAESDEAEVVEIAKKETNATKYLAGVEVVKTIYIKGKTINFVVK